MVSRAGLGLHESVFHRRDPVGVFHDHVRAGEAFLHVSFSHLVAADDVAFPFTDLVCPGLHGFHGVEDSRQGLIGHLDEPQSFFGDFLRLGRYQGDRVAHGSHLLFRENTVETFEPSHLVGLAETGHGLVVGNVLGREHGLHTRQLLCFGGVDGKNFRRRIGTSQDLSTKGARHVEVVGVLGFPKRLVPCIVPGHGLAYDPELVLSHDSFPP